MKKGMKLLLAAMLVLTAVIIISYDEFNEKEDALMLAAYAVRSTEGFEGSAGIIESASYYGKEYLEDEEKLKLLKDMAKALGITGEFMVSSERENNKEIMRLSKTGLNSETILGIVTLEDKDTFGRYSFAQYITCKICIDNSPESVCHYAEILRGYLKENELNANVTSTLISYFDDEFDTKKISSLTDKILKSMNAEVVAENRTKELFSVYAYSKNIAGEDTIELGSVKANINIAANYNEKLNQTRIYFATPILNIEY